MNSKINTCGLVSRSAGRPTEIEDITTISLNHLSGWTSTGEVYNDYLPSYFYIINAHWRETRTQTFSLTFMTDEKSPIDGSAWSINRLAHVLGFMSVCILQRYWSALFYTQWRGWWRQVALREVCPPRDEIQMLSVISQAQFTLQGTGNTFWGLFCYYY